MKFSLTVLLITLLFSGATFSQELKTYKGALDQFQDDYLGVTFSGENGAQAQFSYKLDANEQMVKQGRFTAVQTNVFTVSNQHLGYYGRASGKTLKRVTGDYQNNKQVGVWKYQIVEFGMTLSGGQFNVNKWDWNTLSVNNSKQIESIRTVTVTYYNGQPDGEMKDEVISRGKQVVNVTCKVHNGHFIGDFFGKSAELGGTSYGKFDGNGFYNGEWVEEDPNSGVINKWNFSNGVLIHYVSHSVSTGVKVDEYTNAFAEYLKQIQLPEGLKVDTFQFIKKDNSPVFNNVPLKFSNSDSLYYADGPNLHNGDRRNKYPKPEIFDIKDDADPKTVQGNYIAFEPGKNLIFNGSSAGFLSQGLEMPLRHLVLQQIQSVNDSPVKHAYSENYSVLKSHDFNAASGNLSDAIAGTPNLRMALDTIFPNALKKLDKVGTLYKGSDNTAYINEFVNYQSALRGEIAPYAGIGKLVKAYEKFSNDYREKEKGNTNKAFLLNEYLSKNTPDVQPGDINTGSLLSKLNNLDSLTLAYHFIPTSTEESVVLYFNYHRWDQLQSIFMPIRRNGFPFTFKYIENDKPTKLTENFNEGIRFLEEIGGSNYKLSNYGLADSSSKYVKINFKGKDSLGYVFYALFKKFDNSNDWCITELKIMTEDIASDDIFKWGFNFLFLSDAAKQQNNGTGRGQIKLDRQKNKLVNLNADFVLLYCWQPNLWGGQPQGGGYMADRLAKANPYSKAMAEVQKTLKSLKNKYNDDKLKIISVSKNEDDTNPNYTQVFRNEEKNLIYSKIFDFQQYTSAFYGHLLKFENYNDLFDRLITKIGCSTSISQFGDFIILDVKNKKVYNKITIEELNATAKSIFDK